MHGTPALLTMLPHLPCWQRQRRLDTTTHPSFKKLQTILILRVQDDTCQSKATRLQKVHESEVNSLFQLLLGEFQRLARWQHHTAPKVHRRFHASQPLLRPTALPNNLNQVCVPRMDWKESSHGCSRLLL